MTKNGSILKKVAICAAAAMMVGTFTASQLLSLGKRSDPVGSAASDSVETITDVTGKVASDFTSSLNTDVMRYLPAGIDADREISVIVRTEDTTLVSAYDAQEGASRYANVSAFADSAAGSRVISKIEQANEKALSRLKSAGVDYELGATYNTVLGGFEVVVKAEEYEKIVSALDGTTAHPSISEEYAPAEAQLVKNDVNVYETGIFDSSDSPLKGEGTLIAVLDTGFDYTHSVFDPEVFANDVDESNLYMTKDKLANLVGDFRAATYTRGLSVEKVYINDKIPYAYDYADRDTDVYPLSEQHGTHVAGIILGNNVGSTKNGEDDPTIVGVAPRAQLAAMKVFSDTTSGAKQSWILAALEDCVKLGVDVINMSLGATAGFTVADNEAQRIAYDSVGRAGISLVAAAGNEYNSTFGSEKNGNLGLTSNPDSATVGTPSTYTSALSVASISGVKSSYIKYGDRIIYFNEASDNSSLPKNFVNDILPENVTSQEFEYVTVPGVGTYQDYIGLDVRGKIALVRRGNNTFEEKAKIAIEDMGAAGVIIYNNVSGDISMTVGSTDGAVCSISQDDGEVLAKNATGRITISRNQTAGPFISDFSSWGPTPDLRIKPEITAHGGDILSAVPGQRYDRLSGTSMASPNQAGVTAIIREYVKKTFDLNAGDEATRRLVNARVNQIMMSTTDIAYNNNGLPYAVRKQGAGLANLTKALGTPAYITTYERNDEHLYDGSSRFLVDDAHVMDKAKIEYGDDRDKTGVYDLVFTVNNFSNQTVSYNVGALVQTEGVSETLTVRGDKTVTEKGYALSPAITVSVGGVNVANNTVTVSANSAATVTVRITLSEEDKQYLDSSFANGMFVEGFITLGAQIGLNVPFLAFYGDWTQAPLFDLDYFETDPDAVDSGIDPDEKTLPDAYASQPIGSTYDDYIMYLGSYPFIQDPSSRQVAASRDHVALSNQPGQSVNTLHSVWAGMLRGAKYVDVSITDTTTGEVIWTRRDENVRKTFGNGSAFASSTVEIDFGIAEHDLKNNTKYMVRLDATLDYGTKSEQRNTRSVFEFPFVTDFQAPVITGVEYYTEIDRTDKTAPKTRTYARLSVYDNHYASAAFFGYMRYNTDPTSQYLYELPTFSDYATPITADRANTTTEVIFELTDHLKELRDAVHPTCFTIQLFDYAFNNSTFEIKVPDEIFNVEFTGDMVTTDEDGTQTISLSPNQKYILDPTVTADQWAGTLIYKVEDESVAKIVGDTLLACPSEENTERTTTLSVYKLLQTGEESFVGSAVVRVLGPDDPAYQELDPPGVSRFRITGYRTDKAYYFMTSAERDIGEEGAQRFFPANSSYYGLSMYPSEKVTLAYELLSFEDGVEVKFTSNNERFASVTQDGQIEAISEGSTSIEVSVEKDGISLMSIYVNIYVKDPYERSGAFLTGYRGAGEIGEDGKPTGVVDIGKDLGVNHGITTIEQFAFSHYDLVPKGPEDIIDEEDPYYSKIWFIGENDHIKKIIIPEGVKDINMYAFAGMDGLEEVVLPTTLKKIGMGAFMDCPKLTKVTGLENVQLINMDAFRNTGLTELNFSEVIAIGNNAFRNTNVTSVTLPASAQSIGAYAFADNTGLVQLAINAPSVKLGEGAFANDRNLMSISAINAANLPEGLFNGDERLLSITIGADVESIDRNAFRGTKISRFIVADGNTTFRVSGDGQVLLRVDDETEVLCVVPTFSGTYSDDTVTKIGAGAFSGIGGLTSVDLPNVTEIGESAFYDCPNLANATFGQVKEVSDYAFFGTALRNFNFTNVTSVGDYAFFGSALTTVNIPENTTVGDYAFAGTTLVRSIVLGNNVTVGDYAFANAATYGGFQQYNVSFNDGSVSVMYEYGYNVYDNALRTLSLGDNVTIGSYAFAFQAHLTTLTIGDNVTIGDHAFFIATALREADLSGVTSIGDYAFAGTTTSIVMPDEEDGTIDTFVENHLVQASGLSTVDLSSATRVGLNAFAYNTSLTSVTLGENLKEIAPYAFFGTRISEIDLKNVESIGDYAFGAFTTTAAFTSEVSQTYGAAFTAADLSHATYIGAHAFENAANLSAVTLYAPAAEDVPAAQSTALTIGDYAFAGSIKLATAENLGSAYLIGAHAFDGAALSGTLDLSGATEIGDLAFADNAEVTGVSFGALTEIGDNPFAGTKAVFTKEGEDGTTVDTYDISENVSVLSGVLYRRRVFAGGDLRGERRVDGNKQYYLYGWELISYPVATESAAYTVEEGTVRISARAFMGTELDRVYLPASLAAIGDRAFYGATKLRFIVFSSYEAPILEEQYDESYQEIGDEERGIPSNLPGRMIQLERNGEKNPNLGILPDDVGMWFYDETSFFYGANFVDHIGHWAGDITMIRPKNGVGYDSFNYDQYFDIIFDGPVVADNTTRSVIRAITLLPEVSEITQDNYTLYLAAINEARALYNSIISDEQRVLVENYDKLRRIEENVASYMGGNEPEPTPEEEGTDVMTIVLGVVCGVLGALVILLLVLLIIRAKKNKRPYEDDRRPAKKSKRTHGSDAQVNSANAGTTASGSPYFMRSFTTSDELLTGQAREPYIPPYVMPPVLPPVMLGGTDMERQVSTTSETDEEAAKQAEMKAEKEAAKQAEKAEKEAAKQAKKAEKKAKKAEKKAAKKAKKAEKKAAKKAKKAEKKAAKKAKKAEKKAKKSETTK